MNGRLHAFEKPLTFLEVLAGPPFGELIAAAYHRHGVAAYDAETGDLCWQRRDIRRAQVLSVCHRSAAVFVGLEEGPGIMLALEDGKTLERMRGVRDMAESVHDPVVFLDQYRPRVVRSDGTPVFDIERTTFAFLSVAFGPSRLAVSESGGGIRCFEFETGMVAWTHQPRRGNHCTELAYFPTAGLFVGVLWPHAEGGEKRLVTFDGDGRISKLASLPEAATECLCPSSSALLAADGSLVEIPSGERTSLDLATTGVPG